MYLHKSISASLSYVAGIFYAYTRQKEGHSPVRRLPGGASGALISLAVTGVAIGTSVTFNLLVEEPIKEKSLDCASCALTRGAGTSAGFSGLGMMAITTVHAYRFERGNAPKLVLHAFNNLSKNLYGCLFLFLGGFVGMAIASDLNKKKDSS